MGHLLCHWATPAPQLSAFYPLPQHLLLLLIVLDRHPPCFLTAVTPLCFSWLTPLLQLGHKRRLEECDMYSVLPEDQSEARGEELHRWSNTVWYDYYSFITCCCYNQHELKSCCVFFVADFGTMKSERRQRNFGSRDSAEFLFSATGSPTHGMGCLYFHWYVLQSLKGELCNFGGLCKQTDIFVRLVLLLQEIAVCRN